MTAPRENWEIPVPSPETSKTKSRRIQFFDYLQSQFGWPTWNSRHLFLRHCWVRFLQCLCDCVCENYSSLIASLCVSAPPISVSMELLSYDGRLHHPVDEEKERERERRKGHTLLLCVGCAAYVTTTLEMKAGWILSQRHLGGGSAIPSMDSLRLFVLIFLQCFNSFFLFCKNK